MILTVRSSRPEDRATSALPERSRNVWAYERDGDYFGPAVNRVARVMAAGRGGQILVAGATDDGAEL